jgi:hypothetical protein
VVTTEHSCYVCVSVKLLRDLASAREFEQVLCTGPPSWPLSIMCMLDHL